MGKVYKNNVTGYAGGISHTYDEVVIASVNASSGSIGFGQPVFLNAEGTGVVPITESTDVSRFVGIAVRSGAKTPDVYEDPTGGIANSVASYRKGEVMDVLVRGCITVECTSGTFHFNKMVGAASATASDLTITVPDIYFKTSRDGSGRAEILLTKRNIQ